MSSTTVFKEVESANKAYVSQFNKGSLAIPPKRKFTVITCMDARIDPAKALGLDEGDAHVIRNAGGRASEALRSVIISQKLLGTEAVLVIHHTECGMASFTNDVLRNKIKEESSGKVSADHIDFLTFPDVQTSVKGDVELLKKSDLVKGDIQGYVYDVKSGRLEQVA